MSHHFSHIIILLYFKALLLLRTERPALYRRLGVQGDTGPVLTGWGSRAWLLGMLHDPADDRYYGADNDRMPSFGVEQTLTPRQMELIVDWLRRDWYTGPQD